MEGAKFITYSGYRELSPGEMIKRSNEFYEDINRRRTIREFSDRKVEKEVIINCIRAAGTAPSGANKQPWQFVVVTDPVVKSEIKAGAEVEEREFYAKRAPDAWLADLAALGTDANKPFLEIADTLIVIFSKSYDISEAGKKMKNYYSQESVGIATGMLITALHNSGLATLTHTPSPMGFLNKILKRPEYERPFLILVIGYPKENVKVPDIQRKSLEEIASFI